MLANAGYFVVDTHKQPQIAIRYLFAIEPEYAVVLATFLEL